MEDLGYTWAQVAQEKALMKQLGIDPEIGRLKNDLLAFLEIVEQCDLRHRYEKGDPKTKGIEVRHEIMKHHIAKLREGREA